MCANVLASFAKFERRLIGERTRAAMAVKKAVGHRMTRALGIPEEVRPRLLAERAAGMTYAAIADRLNTEAVPTVRGGSRWYPSTVHAAIRAVAKVRPYGLYARALLGPSASRSTLACSQSSIPEPD